MARSTEIIDKLYRELSLVANVKTEKEIVLENMLREMCSAGVEVLNCWGSGPEAQARRVKYYAHLNAVKAYFGEPYVDPDPNKNDDCGY